MDPIDLNALELENELLHEAFTALRPRLLRCEQLERQNQALQETLDAALQKLAQLTATEFDAQCLHRHEHKAEPHLAVQMLQRHCTVYMQACHSLHDKQQLWREALALGNDAVTLEVTEFLHNTLDDTRFGELVMVDAPSSRRYLKRLRRRQSPQHEALCLRFERWRELVKARLARALQQQCRRARLYELERVQQLAQAHPVECDGLLLERLQDCIRITRTGLESARHIK